MERRSRGLLLGFMLLASWAPPAAWAQYEKYSFRGFPESELMPLQSAYSYALEQYEGEHWKESVRYLEASLRLHRLLRDSEAHCHKECAKPGQGGAPLGEPLRAAGLGEAFQGAGLGEVAQGARQGAPLGEPPQGALLGKPSQGANGEFGQGKEPVQGAPLGEPSQGARLGEPPQGARLGKSRQGSEFGEPSQGARLGEPAQGTPGELGQGAQPLQDARLGEVWQGTETSPGAQQQQLQQQDARLGEPPWVPPDEWLGEMEVFGRILQRASCLRRCKHSLPVFQLSYPPADTLRLFQRRAPYQYLHYALFKTNKIEKAVSAAHTFLQKNPKHEMTQRYLNYYKTMVDVDEYLVDLEAQQYETVFVRAVKLYNSGDFRSSIADMEYALAEYYKAYKNCLFGCEGSYELREFKDFYPAIADHFINVLQCKVDCEADLTPNVGGYFVEKFVATMYHYLQFAYYKLNDIKNAVQSVASYMLFDPGDEVMQQNLVYYRFYRERWHLEEDDFNPRPEALSYHDQTSTQKKLLEFAKQYLQPDDETEVGDGEETGGPALPTDEEFEGIGDYEEGFLAQWWQEPKSKGDKADEGY